MDFGTADLTAIPIISGWVGILKGLIPDEWKKKGLPILSVICGLIYAFSIKDNCGTAMNAMMMGVTLGLSAVGTHSALKNGIEKVNGVKPPTA